MSSNLADLVVQDEWTCTDAAAAASTEVDPAPVLQRAVDEAAALPGVRAAALLVGLSPGNYRVVAVAGESGMPLLEPVSLEGDALTWAGGEQRACVALPWPHPLPRISDVQAACVPVRAYANDLGLLVAFGKPRTTKALSARSAALESIAGSAAPAVAVRRLSEMDTHFTELNAIVEVGQVLTGLLDMEDVLSYVVYLAESLVSGHCAGIALISEEGDDVILHNSTGSLRGSEGKRFPIRDSLMGWVVENGAPVITSCVSDDPRKFPLAERLGPGVVVPVTNSGRVIGAFMVARVEGAAHFGPESAVILQRMSAYAAIAITNAEIHRKQQETANTLRSQAAELERAYGDLTRSQEQLLVSEKMAALGRVTAGIAHEINSPLAGILKSLRTARSYVDEYKTSAGDPEITADDHRAIADDILSALSIADSAVTKVAQYVKSIKGQTRVGEEQAKPFDPAAEVDATVVLIQHESKHRRVAVFTEMERGHRLLGDQGKFGVVIQNLLKNAIDAFEGEPGEVWIRLAARDGRLVLRVEDQGCGIPEDIRGRIFDYMFTTKDVGKGTGLGLAMVHSVVTSHFKGEIQLETEPGLGTTFILTFPLTTTEDGHGA